MNNSQVGSDIDAFVRRQLEEARDLEQTLHDDPCRGMETLGLFFAYTGHTPTREDN